ncbi:MAG: hypothetical protein KBC64_07730, partial [Simkaniaceae bacterium]|nr:hypothetical protein [Simkaniaceae bacterium]
MSISFPTKDAFDASPLFQYTPDKSPIFTMLSRIHERCDRYEYELFINTIRTSNVWWEMCSDHFGKHKIVLFSTVALFNKTITEEEFLMINLAAVAAQESCLSRVVVVAADRIAEYCHSAGYPLFAPAGAPYILQHRCSDIEEKRKKFVGDWGKRSIVERSMVECSVEAKTDSVINDIIMNHRLVGVAPRLEGGRFTLHLFAPQVSVRLSADASLYDGEAPERHLYMMGHSESGDPLYERRRMISCPYLPIPLNTKEQRLKHAPHGLGESPLQIGTYYHDVCYHIPLEYTN